ncbi:TPA: hypothetical protein DCY67_00400 [Candidatus Acetothermia bacterium]|nr:hypothetical protein [Candidatus Acetothermia bacterium]
MRFAKGETVFHEGSPAPGWAVVCQGRVKLVVRTDHGKNLLLRCCGPGELLSGSALGTYPRLQLAGEVSRLWRQYDPLETPGCVSCPAKLCCGGGCWFRRIYAVGSLSRVHCTEHVMPLLSVTMAYLHRMAEVFELAQNNPHRSEQR